MTTPKEIIVEEWYYVVENADKDLLFCISDHEGEPQNPVLYYADGFHAELHRTKNQIIILNYLHSGAQTNLIGRRPETVLIVEMAMDRKKDPEKETMVREYVATVEYVDFLPNFDESEEYDEDDGRWDAWA
ncbi:MAG: hypothetical protein LBN93_11185 [Candidatus Symbiothrix sp.]|jgi:hypothetical protein|nr:hypothetical protein [Candidatus Symbiothrix sp.]